MALPARTEKREDRLPLERALRALEDAQRSLKEFSKKNPVTKNAALKDAVTLVRHKAKKLRKRSEALAGLWDQQFERKS